MGREREDRTRVERRRRAAVLLIVCTLLASACQGVLGIESWTPKASEPDAGSCLRASDCSGSQVCLFKICSEPCANDRDCANDTYCLRTIDGTACVSPEQADCGSTVCPEGSSCSGGHCLTSCADGAQYCPGGQQCSSAGVCAPLRPDAGSEPDSSVASGGGGEGGAAGVPNGGAADAGAATGGAPSGGSGGSSGSVGISGATVIDDGTAIGSAKAACGKSGALACAGHAQADKLACQSSTWESNGICATNLLCDSTPGTNAGSCQPVVAECSKQAAGFRFCRSGETDVRKCGVDLVTAPVVESCPFICSAGACKGECHPGAKQCKPGTLVPQSCSDQATWDSLTACDYRCDNATGKCISAACGDGALNGDETDKDCGGSCSGCAVGSACKKNGDCVLPASGKCGTDNKCAAASCGDGVKNGSETDSDCGGSCATPCAIGYGCSGDADCKSPESAHCSSGKCIAAACNDGIKNGTETDKDCGGTCAADCANGLSCAGDGDCVSGACLSGKCVACKPDAKQCAPGGTVGVQTCSATGAWGNTVACSLNHAISSCSAGVCGVASCVTGYGNCDAMVSTGCELALDSVSHCGSCTATCNAPAQACVSLACASNDPHNLGQSSSSGWSTFNAVDNRWYLQPITISTSATVQALRILSRSANGALARLALWNDDGTGRPGTLVTYSQNLSLVAGQSGGSSQVAAQLTAGKTYWIGAVFSGGAQLYQTAAPTTQTDYTYDSATAFADATPSPFPANFASAITGVAVKSWNLFLLVQDVPN